MSKEIKETETDEDFIQSSGELLEAGKIGKRVIDFRNQQSNKNF